MRKLLFFSRVAFICNIFFVVAFSIQMTNWIPDEQIRSTIVLLGYVLGLPLNLIVNLFYLGNFIGRRPIGSYLPVWLITANILFLVIQTLYIIYLNGPQYS